LPTDFFVAGCSTESRGNRNLSFEWASLATPLSLPWLRLREQNRKITRSSAKPQLVAQGAVICIRYGLSHPRLRLRAPTASQDPATGARDHHHAEDVLLLRVDHCPQIHSVTKQQLFQAVESPSALLQNCNVRRKAPRDGAGATSSGHTSLLFKAKFRVHWAWFSAQARAASMRTLDSLPLGWRYRGGGT